MRLAHSDCCMEVVIQHWGTIKSITRGLWLKWNAWLLDKTVKAFARALVRWAIWGGRDCQRCLAYFRGRGGITNMVKYFSTNKGQRRGDAVGRSASRHLLYLKQAIIIGDEENASRYTTFSCSLGKIETRNHTPKICCVSYKATQRLDSCSAAVWS